jgi:hypothetical protein
VSTLGVLFSDTTSRGFRQAFAEVTPGETDVFQFPIAELTEDSNIRRACSACDFAGNPAVYEETEAGHNKPEPLPDCCRGGFGIWGDIENCHRNFFRRLAIRAWGSKKGSNMQVIGGHAVSDVGGWPPIKIGRLTGL